MAVETVIYAAVGILLAALGILTWKKQKITLLHEYHRKNVKKEDEPAYTKRMGIGQIITGAGLFLTGIIRIFTLSGLSFAPFIAGLCVGFAVMHTAQMKYNGSWFS